MRRWIFVSFFAALGCASSPLQQHARARDWAGLEHAISEQEARGEWSANDARKLAHDLLAADLKAQTAKEPGNWVAGLRLCSSALLSELKERSQGSDDTAAELTRILEEVDQVQLQPLVREHAASSNPHWRAVAIRAAVEPADATLLLKALNDGDAGVRRAALEAMDAANESAQLQALLQVTRHDPDPLNRSLAARVAAAVGGEQAVLFLRDYWQAVSPAERVAYVEAWAGPQARGAGGERELEWVIATQHGMAQVTAAALLQRHSQAAQAVLLEALHSGAVEEQRLAAQLISLESAVNVAALKRVESDPTVMVLIWHRLVQLPKEEQRAIAALKVQASKFGPAAHAARYALAAAGDDSVLPILLAELTVSDKSMRLQAAYSLIALHQDHKAGHLLADRSDDLRRKIACMLLAPKPDSH